ARVGEGLEGGLEVEAVLRLHVLADDRLAAGAKVGTAHGRFLPPSGEPCALRSAAAISRANAPRTWLSAATSAPVPDPSTGSVTCESRTATTRPCGSSRTV